MKNGKKFFGVNINVQNVTGGTGVIGMNQVARAKADGYTSSLVTFNLSTYRLLGQSELSYRDFDLIALLNRSIAGLTVKTDSQFKTLKDLVEYAKANPGWSRSVTPDLRVPGTWRRWLSPTAMA